MCDWWRFWPIFILKTSRSFPIQQVKEQETLPKFTEVITHFARSLISPDVSSNHFANAQHLWKHTKLMTGAGDMSGKHVILFNLERCRLLGICRPDSLTTEVIKGPGTEFTLNILRWLATSSLCVYLHLSERHIIAIHISMQRLQAVLARALSYWMRFC